MLTLTKNGTAHKVKIKESKHDGEIVVRIFINKDKMPYVGTWFSKLTPLSEIIQWAEDKINDYPKCSMR